MTEVDENGLALLIVNNPYFADAYQLCKVLAWKFGIINCSEIITRMEKMNYLTITYPKSPTLKFFHLTEDGRMILEQERSSLGKRLVEGFPEHAEFIEKLVARK
jgi:hypothetical protein